MNGRYSSNESRKLNIAVIICVAAVLVLAVCSVLVQALAPQPQQPEDNDLGVVITATDFLPGEPDPIVGTQVSQTDVTQNTTTTETAATTTTTTTAPPATNSSYDVTIKDSAAVRQTLTQIMQSGDLALLDNILATGSNLASASTPESTYDVNGQLCIVDSEMQAVKYEYYIQGAGERVILLCTPDGRVYVGLVTGSQMRYYTNDSARLTNAPGCISGYAAALSLELKNMSA